MTKRTDGLHNQTWRQRGKGKQSAKGPLKKVLYVNQSDGSLDAFFSRNELMLECGHLVWAYARNQTRVRCWKCRDEQAGGTTLLAPDAAKSASELS